MACLPVVACGTAVANLTESVQKFEALSYSEASAIS